jgi:hypothetical protein
VLFFTAASKAKNWASTTALPIPHDHTSRYCRWISSLRSHACSNFTTPFFFCNVKFYLSNELIHAGLELRLSTSTRLKACLYSFTSPGGPTYPTRAVRHAAWNTLDLLFPVSTTLSTIIIQLCIHCTMVPLAMYFETNASSYDVIWCICVGDTFVCTSAVDACIEKFLSGCLDDILCFCDTKQMYLPGDWGKNRHRWTGLFSSNQPILGILYVTVSLLSPIILLRLDLISSFSTINW